MSDPRLTRTAEILLHYSTAVQAGEWALIDAHFSARPLVEEVCRQLWEAGVRVNILWQGDDLTESLLTNASDEVLGWLSPAEELLFEKVNVLFYLHGADNTHSLAGVAPEKMVHYQQSRGKLRQIRNRRVQTDGLRWVYTQYPCQALAQEAGMVLRAYEEIAYAASYADQPDPLACWQSIRERQQHWVDWLAGRKKLILRGANIDLQLSVAGRTFINACGQTNLPDGEIYTGPVEDSAEGWVRFSYPAIFNGRSVEGIELTIKAGKVVSAHAARDEAFLHSMLDTDAGASFLGEFAIGTNDAIRDFTRNILYDEKLGGTIHLALGNGYPETGSLNRSLIHWDLICDLRQDGEILVDGELFFRNGEFQI